MLKIAINGKKHEVASCREELTTHQYQRIVKELKDPGDWLSAFAILIGSERNELAKSKDYDTLNSIFAVVDFIYTEDWEFLDNEVPRFIEIGGKTLQVPDKLGALSLEQAIHLRQKTDNAETLNECISYAVALYLQPLYDESEFDLNRALDFEKEVLKTSIALTYPVGFFFLRKYCNYGSEFTKTLNSTRIMLMKATNRFQNWLTPEG